MKNIIIKELSVFIKEKQILKNINIEFCKGSFVAILGKNGNGKTSIFNAIMNHYNFNKQGKIFLGSKDISNFETDEISKKGIWYIPQNSQEIKGLNVLIFLKEILKSKNLYDNKTFLVKISELCKSLNLSEEIFERDLNIGFSGGEKKKFEILQLLLINPKYILIDEIDSGLDKTTIDFLIETLNNFKKEGKTIVIITHNQEFLKKLDIDLFVSVKNGSIENIKNEI